MALSIGAAATGWPDEDGCPPDAVQSLVALVRAGLSVAADVQLIDPSELARLQQSAAPGPALLGRLGSRILAERAPLLIPDLPRVAQRADLSGPAAARSFIGCLVATATGDPAYVLCATTDLPEKFTTADLRLLSTAGRGIAEVVALRTPPITPPEMFTALNAISRNLIVITVQRDSEGAATDLIVQWMNAYSLGRLGKPLAAVAGKRLGDIAPTIPGGEEETLRQAARGEPTTFVIEPRPQDLAAGARAHEVILTPLGTDTLLLETANLEDRYQAERALEHTNKLLNASQQMAGIGSGELNFATGIVKWSPSTFLIHGYDPAGPAPTLEECGAMILEEDVPALMQALDEGAVAGQCVVEYRVRRPDGAIRAISAWFDVETDADGQLKRAIGVLLDETDRRQREVDILKSRELERLVIDRSPIGIALLNEAGCYEQVNGALCAMLGRTREQMLGAQSTLVIVEEDAEAIPQTHAALLSGELASDASDVRYVHANGRQLWVSEHKTLLSPTGTDEPARILVQVIDISERQRRADELTRLARTDALTGLANRRAWEPRLATALQDALSRSLPLSVAIFDLDKFKNFNDTFGHPVGDELLAETSAAWRAFLIRHAPRGLLARLGGEEFGVLLPATSTVEARTLLERMIGLVPRGQTASAGLTRAHDNDDAHSVMTRADEALYLAKAAGRARVDIIVAHD